VALSLGRTRGSGFVTEPETFVTNRSQAHKSGRVRRTSREESGAQTTVSRSKRVRLILGEPPILPLTPPLDWPDEP
jgi:hypothetical protein